MENLLKIAVAAILISAIGMLIKSIRPELNVPISVLAVVIICLSLMPEILQAKELTKTFSQNPYMETILKITGIAYITHFTADICRSAGEQALASGVELSGKISVMMLTLPLAGSLVSIAESFL